ncbi:MAG TPA: hypothetical protein VEV64_08620 [Rhizomicrobium sp.]|jgi:hypothetical protein|nr:hypothetical protein [Rhizomicrobium sp.]
MHKAIGTWVFLITLAGLATMSPAAADDQTAPCQVVATQTPCPTDPQAEARWARKRLRELDEQAETARLNREFNPAPLSVSAPPVTASAPQPSLPLKTPPRQAENVPPAQYRSALEEYQALREAYDRQLRAYYRAFPAQAAAHTAPPSASSAAPTQAELAAQDAARANPWHGFNRQNGPGNGY